MSDRMRRYGISLFLMMLWAVWGIDVVREFLPNIEHLWWMRDLQITLWLLPYAVLFWWGMRG